jgi:hypothetical protein
MHVSPYILPYSCSCNNPSNAIQERNDGYGTLQVGHLGTAHDYESMEKNASTGYDRGWEWDWAMETHVFKFCQSGFMRTEVLLAMEVHHTHNYPPPPPPPPPPSSSSSHTSSPPPRPFRPLRSVALTEWLTRPCFSKTSRSTR